MPMPGRRASDGFWAGDPRTLPMSWSGALVFKELTKRLVIVLVEVVV